MASSKTRKQKRISKHVIKAKEDQASKPSTDNSDLPIPPHEQKKQKQPNSAKKSKKHTKDPIEAASYLSSWKHREAGGAWKFNKNTQSWLIRHMYEPEKVHKATFETLMIYLSGMHKKDRVIEDAQRRALRYKEFQSTLEVKKGDAEDDENVIEDEKKSEADIPGDDEDDDTRWNRLNAHDRRKEYKRARKVLETLQE